MRSAGAAPREARAPRSCGCRRQARDVDLRALLDELGRREILTLLVEGGGQVHGAFLAAGLADEVALLLAPKLIGAGGVPLIGVDGPCENGRRVAAGRGFDAPARR